MRPFFSLFHADSAGYNRTCEDQFQLLAFVRDKEHQLQRIHQSTLEGLVEGLRDQAPNHDTLLSLARIFATTLEHDAYDLFIDENRVTIGFTFYDEQVPKANGIEVDFEETKKLHYRKYCLFKFASFLELLSPRSIRWRGQAELESERQFCKSLERFQTAGLQDRALMLSRWVSRPDLSAFSARKSERSRKIAERRAFLFKLPAHLPMNEVAARLDNAGFRPQRHLSFTAWLSLNYDSFASWLSRERAEAIKMWDPSLKSPKRS